MATTIKEMASDSGFIPFFEDADIVGKYQCEKCHLLLHRAMQSSCGHRFCLSCSTEISENKLKCPSDKCFEDIQQFWPDRYVRRDISELRVRCSECEWSGKYEDFNIHLGENHLQFDVKPETQAVATHALLNIQQLKATSSAYYHYQKISEIVDQEEELIETLMEKLEELKRLREQLKPCERKLSQSMELIQLENTQPVSVDVIAKKSSGSLSQFSVTNIRPSRQTQYTLSSGIASMYSMNDEQHLMDQNIQPSGHTKSIQPSNTSSPATLVTGVRSNCSTPSEMTGGDSKSESVDTSVNITETNSSHVYTSSTKKANRSNLLPPIVQDLRTSISGESFSSPQNISEAKAVSFPSGSQHSRRASIAGPMVPGPPLSQPPLITQGRRLVRGSKRSRSKSVGTVPISSLATITHKLSGELPACLKTRPPLPPIQGTNSEDKGPTDACKKMSTILRYDTREFERHVTIERESSPKRNGN